MRRESSTTGTPNRLPPTLSAATIAALARSRIGHLSLRAIAVLLAAAQAGRDHPPTQTALRTSLGLTHSQMQRAADTLVRAGLLSRSYAADRRQKSLRILRAGQRAVTSALHAASR